VKAAPGKYNYASTGNGTGTHLAFAEFVHKAGLDMVHVPYKGGPEAIQGVLAGDVVLHLQPGADGAAAFARRQGAAAGRHHQKRVPAIADVPTIDEAGVPGYESYTWFGIFGPRASPRRSPQKMNAASRSRSKTPRRRRRWPTSATPRATRRWSSSRPR
jgi:tripartite-type tricarboxylate transporter receptor subunit TctC